MVYFIKIKKHQVDKQGNVIHSSHTCEIVSEDEFRKVMAILSSDLVGKKFELSVSSSPTTMEDYKRIGIPKELKSLFPLSNN